VTIPAGAKWWNVAAPCPSNAIAISGGYSVRDGVEVVSESAVDFQQSWVIEVSNPGSQAGTARAYSLCLTN